jgi:hypothetical protein
MKMIRMAVVIAAATAAASKAKEYARENPDKASETIDKAEAFVAGKAGPKYAGKVGKGSDALRHGLGLPAGTSSAEGSTGASSSNPTSAPSPGTASPTTAATDGSGPDTPPKAFDPSI